jgi:hypothetical protein
MQLKRGKAISVIFLVLLSSIIFTPIISAEDVYVKTIAYTDITHNSTKMHGYLELGSGDNCTVWFEYGKNNSMINRTENISSDEGQYFSETIYNLTPGQIYYFRSAGETDQGYENGTIMNLLTKPEGPLSIGIVNMSGAGGYAFNISWEHGQGYNKSILKYDNISHPTTYSSGKTLYYGNESYCMVRVSDLYPGKRHYFSVWEYSEWSINSTEFFQYSSYYMFASENFTITAIKPTITCYPVSNIKEEEAYFNAYLYDGNETCTVRFWYGKNITETTNTTNQTKETGYFYTNVSDLDPGTYYYVGAYANNTVGSDESNVVNFLTKPYEPTNLQIHSYTESQINIEWTKGIGANTTRIVRKTGNYPLSEDDGITIYNGTGEAFADTNFTSYASQYYRVWSYTNEEGITQRSINSSMTFTINAEFSINFPRYLKTGDYLLAWGMIADIDGKPIQGFISDTKIVDMLGNTVLGPVKWNCSDGNYQAAFSTTAIPPGQYDIVVTFENSTGITFTYVSRLYLAINPDEDIYVDAFIYYSFYDISTGTGLDDNFYKVYISKDEIFSPGDRVKGGKIGVLQASGESIVTNGEYFIQIRDFNNNIIPFSEYNDELLTPYDIPPVQNAYAGFTVKAPEFYIDLGVYLNQLRIKNMNSSTVYIVLRRTDGYPGQILGRFIPPWEESEVFIPDGMYNLSIHYYDNNHPEYGPTKITYPWDYTGAGQSLHIKTDMFYWIQGYNLEDVINIVESEGTWLYYTTFDMNTGSQLKDDFYKVYISEDTTINEDDRIKGGKFKTELGDTLHIQIKDYWNNQVYPFDGKEYDNITIANTKTFIDIGIPLNQFLIKNTNITLVYFKITNGNWSDPVNNTWYNRWIPPGESAELFIRSGTYNISMEFYYPHNATFIKFENISNYQINRDLFFVIQGYNSRVYFNYYNSEQGLGLPFDVLKTYVDGVRIPNNYIQTYLGSTINIMVKDYYSDIMLNKTVKVKGVLNYIDLELTTLSYKFANLKDDFFVIGLKKENAVVWWEKIVCPYETIEFLAPPGNYSVRVYNTTFSLAEFNTTINASRAFTIAGHDLNASVNLVLEGQQKIIAEIRMTNETFNFTNSMIFDILGLYYYSNQTIQSILNAFRQPHIWQVPTINYTMEDKTPPISTIHAVITIDSSIKVSWQSSDNTRDGVDYVKLYYQMENASWKEWFSDLPAKGNKYFNSTTEEILTEGKNYSFRVLGTDIKGNIEEPSLINTYTLTYQKYIPPSGMDPMNILNDLLSNWVFILVISLIIILVIAVILLERRKDKKEEIEERARRVVPIGLQYEDEYLGEEIQREPYQRENNAGGEPYYGGPFY